MGTVKNVREIGINPTSRYYKELPLNSGPEDYSVRTDFSEPSLSRVIIPNVPNIFKFHANYSPEHRDTRRSLSPTCLFFLVTRDAFQFPPSQSRKSQSQGSLRTRLLDNPPSRSRRLSERVISARNRTRDTRTV